MCEPRGGEEVSQVIACETTGDGGLGDAAREGHPLRPPVMTKFVGEARVGSLTMESEE